MKHKIFCVYDSAADAYLPPFFMPESGQAIRVFGDCVNSADHQFGKHPSDYTLFFLGGFDDRSAWIDLESAPVKLINGVEARKGAKLPGRESQDVLDFEGKEKLSA